MRASQFLLLTQKETPADAEIISHQLMLRAGMIRKLSSGLYSWLPLGLRVLRNIERIIREELNDAGAQEILMPAVQPADIWRESGRWDNFDPPLLKMQDRHMREFCFGPTHEEVITDLMRNAIKSYRQVPFVVFQIQSKFRDELRPRSGVMRAREFTMKDAYSFHENEQSLANTYEIMRQAYIRIFTRLGLDFRCVQADSGSIGGNKSHEFHVLAKSGEDRLAYSDSSDYAANVEMAAALSPVSDAAEANASISTVTIDSDSDEDVFAKLNIEAKQFVKIALVRGTEHPIIAIALRGDHELNEIKIEKHPEVSVPAELISEQEAIDSLGCHPNQIGPVGLSIPLIVDHSAAHLSDFVCAANQANNYYAGVNWKRDLPLDETFDARMVVAGDPSPDGKGTLNIIRGIEIGHIFDLGRKYSQPMHASILNEQGQQIPMHMGCYGIGVSRLVAAAIEQNHDDNGIIWPESIAPFTLAIVAMNYHKSDAVKVAADELYGQLKQQGIEVLLDNRGERAGTMFADMDLIGIPHRLVVSDRGLKNGTIEYKARNQQEAQAIAQGELLGFINSTIQSKYHPPN